MNSRLPLLLANAVPPDRLGPFRLCAGAGSVELIAAAESAAGEAPKLPRFKMNVYNGGPMVLAKFGLSIVDIEGLSIPERALPVHRDHDPGQIVGHGQGAKGGGRVSIEGVISGTGPAAAEVRDNSKNGFPWQASMEAQPLRVEEVRAGATAKVNGRTVAGPILVFRKSELLGASFVSLGADLTTRVQVAASLGGGTMDPKFREWLIAAGFDKPEALSEAQVASLKAAYDAELIQAELGAGDGGGQEPPAKTPEPVKAPSAADEIKAERQRVAGIEAACAGEWEPETAKKVAEIRAAAVRDGESIADVNAKVLRLIRASRPAAGAPAFIGGAGATVSAQVLTAALCMANRPKVGMDDAALVASFGAQTCEAAHRLARVRLTEILAACAEMDGVSLPRFGRGSNEWIRAAFSSLSLPGILGDVANKTLLAAYAAVPSAARQIARIGQVSDFKVHTRYRLTSDFTFKKVEKGGELPHGVLGEQSFPVQADTYGIYFQLTRQDVVNDDLGAFLDIPRMMGRGSAISIEEIFFTLLLANTGSFFGSGNANIYANAAAALGNDSLSYMVALLRNQTDPKGKPVNVTPAILLVPPALKDLADRLYVSRNLIVTRQITATTTPQAEPDANTHAGKYRPVDSPYLSNTGFHANASAVDWYLFANPADLAAFEIAFLNGVENPTVESVGVAPNVLGLGFRGYHDVGVAALDPRAGAKADVG